MNRNCIFMIKKHDLRGFNRFFFFFRNIVNKFYEYIDKVMEMAWTWSLHVAAWVGLHFTNPSHLHFCCHGFCLRLPFSVPPDWLRPFPYDNPYTADSAVLGALSMSVLWRYLLLSLTGSGCYYKCLTPFWKGSGLIQSVRYCVWPSLAQGGKVIFIIPEGQCVTQPAIIQNNQYTNLRTNNAHVFKRPTAVGTNKFFNLLVQLLGRPLWPDGNLLFYVNLTLCCWER